MDSTTTPTVKLGDYVQPAGAQLRSSPDEVSLSNVWEEVGKCFGYLKPDGWRLQIHKQGNVVTCYSRSGKDWTSEYSHIAQLIRTQVKIDQVILDTELVGFDAEGYHLDPSRLRTADQFRCYLLDLLYLDERDLTPLPLLKRVALLWEYLNHACKGGIVFANYTFVQSLNDLIELYQTYQRRKKEGYDGIIIKRPDASYFNDVLKVKPEETIDAVVVGAYFNEKGGLKTLLLAVPSRQNKRWVPIAKVKGTGPEWDAIYAACQPHKKHHRPDDMDDPPDRPDVWFTPDVVVATSLTEIRQVKNYQIFAFGARRCVLREDKGPDDATSFEQVRQMENIDDATSFEQVRQTDNLSESTGHLQLSLFS